MWITRDFNLKEKRLPVFYKQFRIDKEVAEGAMKISALGIFRIKINGVEIDDYFMPGWTNYNKFVSLCSYDLTEYLKKDNLLEITVADGWYAGRLGYNNKSHVYGKVKALYAELTLSYADGTEETVVTDGSWRIGPSEIVKSSFFDGEEIDFRVGKTELRNLPFAVKYDKEIKFENYDCEPVKEIAEFTPTVLYERENTALLDFKQNFAGFVTFAADGGSGTEITVRYSEILSDDGTPYYENLRSARATDKIVLSGKREIFRPTFTFHGFRYAEISVKGNARIEDVKGIALSQSIRYGGKFRCSDETVNAVFRNALWGQKSNFISIPTDCPQRDERLGWTGDAQVFCNSAMFNGNCDRFFASYLKLIRTDILPDGKVPSFVPFFIPVSTSTAGVPGWADAICIIPYTHYLHYRDANVIKDNLHYAVKHLEYYLGRSEDYLLKVENPFGDWLSTEKADDADAINQCFFGLSAFLISEMYAVLKDGEKRDEYREIYENAKRAFRENYMASDGRIVGDSQTVYALSLAVGFASGREVKTRFVESVKRAGGKLTTGFIGVKHLLPALCDIGETELAYKIIKETEYPSWGYTVKQGATTVWERWNGYTKENGFETPGMNSFNHYSLGSCVEWLYTYVLGIKLPKDKEICISPSFCKEFSFAEGEYGARNGKIRVEWKYDDGKYYINVNADDGVEFGYDFGDRRILRLESGKNRLAAVLKE